MDSSRKQIKHSVDSLLGNKLYLHHFDLFRACGSQHGQRDVSKFISPVDNHPFVLFVYKTHLIGVMSLLGHPLSLPLHLTLYYSQS